MVLPKSPQCQNHSQCQERIHFDEDEKLVINRAWYIRSSFQRSNGAIKKNSSRCLNSHQAGDNETPSGRSSTFTSTAANIQALFGEVKSLCAGLIELRAHTDHSLEELGQPPSTRSISELIELQAIDHSMEKLGRAMVNASTE